MTGLCPFAPAAVWPCAAAGVPLPVMRVERTVLAAAGMCEVMFGASSSDSAVAVELGAYEAAGGSANRALRRIMIVDCSEWRRTAREWWGR